MRAIASTVLAVTSLASLGLPAHAAEDDVEVAPVTDGLSIGVSHHYPDSETNLHPDDDLATDQVLVVDPGVDLVDEFCDGINWTVGCVPDPEIQTPEAVTPGLVATAFRRLPLPEAKLVIQPPKGRTLVNFETNFYTEQGEFTRTVTLLGRVVELRIWPASFGWRFGDGESDQTASPGAAYPDLEITHTYLEKGRVSPSVDTTYAAQFRVGGGPWRDVAGTVTIPGSPQELRVVEARPVLVGG
jgi:hypothetical protein